MTIDKLYNIFNYIIVEINNFINRFNSKKSKYEIYEANNNEEDEDEVLLNE